MSCRSAKCGDYCPCADVVDRYREVLDGPVAQEDAEDVEHVMTIIGKRERVYDSVVMHHQQHYRHDWYRNH